MKLWLRVWCLVFLTHGVDARQSLTVAPPGYTSNCLLITHGHNSVKSETIKEIFFTGRFLGKFVIKWILKIPPHIAYVATLACETLTAAKQAIGDKLQCSVATYFRCGGVVNQTRKGLLLSLSVKKISNRWIFGKVRSKNVLVSCTFFVF